MSRTWRRANRHERRAGKTKLRDGQAYRCVSSNCIWCSDGRTYARRRAEFDAKEEMLTALQKLDDS